MGDRPDTHRTLRRWTKNGGGKSDEYEKETRSSLSSLTGDDVSQGSDRIFFGRNLPHFCSSIIGFSAVEAALEIGNFNDEEGASVPDNQSSSFIESSARYERNLISELDGLLSSPKLYDTTNW